MCFIVKSGSGVRTLVLIDSIAIDSKKKPTLVNDRSGLGRQDISEKKKNYVSLCLARAPPFYICWLRHNFYFLIRLAISQIPFIPLLFLPSPFLAFAILSSNSLCIYFHFLYSLSLPPPFCSDFCSSLNFSFFFHYSFVSPSPLSLYLSVSLSLSFPLSFCSYSDLSLKSLFCLFPL